MLANGIGSFWYHGPYHEAGARLHDAAAIAYAGLVAVADSGGPRRFPEAVAVVAGFATMAAAIDRRTTGVGAATIGAILAGVEAARAGGDDHPGRGGLAMTAAAAAGAYVLGRSDSRLCRPESPLQLHALWHLLAAAAGMAWMRARLPSTG